MGKAFNADVHSPLENFLFSVFSKHLLSSSHVPDIIVLLLLTVATTTTVSSAPPSPHLWDIHDVPGIVLSPLQT